MNMTSANVIVTGSGMTAHRTKAHAMLAAASVKDRFQANVLIALVTQSIVQALREVFAPVLSSGQGRSVIYTLVHAHQCVSRVLDPVM